MPRAFALLLPIALLAACESSPLSTTPFGVSNDHQVLPGRPGPGLVADSVSPIPDVPKPIGFKPLPELCSSSSDGRARTVHHVYQGLAGPGDAVAFYRRQLPAKGWTLTSFASPAGGESTLSFTKGPESLSLRTIEKGTIVTLVIDIGPAGSLP